MTEHEIEALAAAMTIDELAGFVAGEDIWSTLAIERLGIPKIKVTDGPNGARGAEFVGGVKSACFPCAITLGSSWNVELLREVGAALANQTKSKGARVLLAPTVNIHRATGNGRNFECYSEDPCLTSALGCAYIEGLQGEGVAATIKHFIGNESEFERMSISSEMGERELREIYLPPFEDAVKKAGIWAIMHSYNRLNGTFTGEHQGLLQTLLKGEWGFDGVVMSDWFATHSTDASANGGTDLEMPGPPIWRGEKLAQAVRAVRVDADTLRDAARRLLRLIDRVGAFADAEIPAESALDRVEDRALIRRAGAEGSVLLTNDGILPLDPSKKLKIAVIGPNAMKAQIMGGGSATLNALYAISPMDGLHNVAGAEVEFTFAEGAENYRYVPVIDAPVKVEFFGSLDLSGPVQHEQTLPTSEAIWFGEIGAGIEVENFSARMVWRYSPAKTGRYTISLHSGGLSRVFVDDVEVLDQWRDWRNGGTYFGFGSDPKLAELDLVAGKTYQIRLEFSSHVPSFCPLKCVRLGLHLPLDKAAVSQAASLAADADIALVFAGRMAEWDSEGGDIPSIQLPGRQDELIAAVAAANPKTVVVLQTGGPVATPWSGDVAAILQAWYPGQECGNAIADVLFGLAEPAGRLPQSYPVEQADNSAFDGGQRTYPGENGQVHYDEGVFVGYRHHDRSNKPAAFSFGHGLSYTSFRWSPLRADRVQTKDGVVHLAIDVTNTGARTGSEVVQIFVAPSVTNDRPVKELRAFAKAHLQPGETKTLKFALNMRDFARFDVGRSAWVADKGSYRLLACASSTDIRHSILVELTQELTEATTVGWLN